MLFLVGTQRCDACGNTHRAVFPVHLSDELPCPFCGEQAAHPIGPSYLVDMTQPRQANVADGVEAAMLTVRHLCQEVIRCRPS
jgi:hypothetical protein